ncbi:MAG TPA: GNAT family N-acetyltransferase [Xanthobacteraceae bacterium]|jgi:RimJ/RimL family protein N-acetyltransferase
MTLAQAQRRQQSREGIASVIETRRLILRAPRLADAEAIAAVANDLRIAENTARLPHPYGVKDAEAFVFEASRGNCEAAFLITLMSGEIVGVCGITTAERRGPELGYWVGAPHWGHGYATEAARALIGHAFTNQGHATLSARVRVSNPASRRVLEKCGFQWSGVELRRIRAIASAAPFDRYQLDRGLWASITDWGKTLARAHC